VYSNHAIVPGVTGHSVPLGDRVDDRLNSVLRLKRSGAGDAMLPRLPPPGPIRI